MQLTSPACSQSSCPIALLYRQRQVCCTLPGQKRSHALQLARQCQSNMLTAKSNRWHCKTTQAPNRAVFAPKAPNNCLWWWLLPAIVMLVIAWWLQLPARSSCPWIDSWPCACHNQGCVTQHICTSSSRQCFLPFATAALYCKSQNIKLYDPADGCVSPCTSPKGRHAHILNCRVLSDDQ